jgi:hypothetical protein
MVTNTRNLLYQSPKSFHQMQMAMTKVYIIWISTSPNTICIISTDGKDDSKGRNFLFHPMPSDGGARIRT